VGSCVRERRERNHRRAAIVHGLCAKKAPGRPGAFNELRGDTLAMEQLFLPESAQQPFAGVGRVVRFRELH
jgi:hypothetical protein